MADGAQIPQDKSLLWRWPPSPDGPITVAPRATLADGVTNSGPLTFFETLPDGTATMVSQNIIFGGLLGATAAAKLPASPPAAPTTQSPAASAPPATLANTGSSILVAISTSLVTICSAVVMLRARL